MAASLGPPESCCLIGLVAPALYCSSHSVPPSIAPSQWMDRLESLPQPLTVVEKYLLSEAVRQQGIGRGQRQGLEGQLVDEERWLSSRFIHNHHILTFSVGNLCFFQYCRGKTTIKCQSRKIVAFQSFRQIWEPMLLFWNLVKRESSIDYSIMKNGS